MREAEIIRPITGDSLAYAVGAKHFEVTRFLIDREIFLDPLEVIDDESSMAFARSIGITLIILDDEDRPPEGDSIPAPPPGSTPPSTRGAREQ